MRVKNPSDATLKPTDQFTIVDTENNKFQPVPIDAAVNPFVYVPVPLQHAQVLPEPESPSANGPIQGAMILFQLSTDSLQNRPLTLHIQGAGGAEALQELDL